MTLTALTRDLAALRPGSDAAFRLGSRRVIVRRRHDGRWDVLRRGGNLVTLCASTAGEAARHALGRARCDAETAASYGRPVADDAPTCRADRGGCDDLGIPPRGCPVCGLGRENPRKARRSDRPLRLPR